MFLFLPASCLTKPFLKLPIEGDQLFAFLNHTMPIMATVKAVRAATGLMACKIEVAAKKVTTATRATKTSIVPIARFLWLILSILTAFKI